MSAKSNPYAPPTVDTAPVLEQYPNQYASQDRGKVIGAGVTLIILGALQLLFGAVFALGAFHVPFASVMGIATLAEGGLNITLGIFTLRNSYGAAVTGLVLAILGLVMSVLQFNIIAIGIRIGIVTLIGRGVSVLKEINNRIATPRQTNPLTGYYHHFVPLLVEVMKADGHLDRRERRRIIEICDSMNISRYEQQRLINKATSTNNANISQMAKQYVKLSNEISLPNPERQMIISAAAIAGADGVIADAEEKLILEIASAMAMPPGEAEALIAHQKAQLDSINVELARKLLNVNPNDPPESIEASYNSLKQELEAARYSHLGNNLGMIAEKHRQVIDKAYQMLGSAEK